VVLAPASFEDLYGKLAWKLRTAVSSSRYTPTKQGDEVTLD